MLHVAGQAWNVEGVDAVLSWGRPSVYGGSVCKGQTGINQGCSKTKQFSQDLVGEARKDGIRG